MIPRHPCCRPFRFHLVPVKQQVERPPPDHDKQGRRCREAPMNGIPDLLKYGCRRSRRPYFSLFPGAPRPAGGPKKGAFPWDLAQLAADPFVQREWIRTPATPGAGDAKPRNSPAQITAWVTSTGNHGRSAPMARRFSSRRRSGFDQRRHSGRERPRRSNQSATDQEK